jgi:tRNA uridine 5-carbamoylmethylation protein Kti12
MAEHGEKVMILLCGVPGCGKSTLSELIRQSFEIIRQPALILAFDEFEHPKGDLNTVQSSPNSAEDWTELTFAESRRRSLVYLTEILRQSGDQIVIIDDIMFYRSMRKEVYRIGREYHSSFVIIHVQTSLENALQRNEERPATAKIPQEVISPSPVYFHLFWFR